MHNPSSLQTLPLHSLRVDWTSYCEPKKLLQKAPGRSLETPVNAYCVPWRRLKLWARGQTAATGTRTLVARVRAEYPNQPVYSGDVFMNIEIACRSLKFGLSCYCLLEGGGGAGGCWLVDGWLDEWMMRGSVAGGWVARVGGGGVARLVGGWVVSGTGEFLVSGKVVRLMLKDKYKRILQQLKSYENVIAHIYGV